MCVRPLIPTQKYGQITLTEKTIILDSIDAAAFYGVGNAHLRMLSALFPKLRIVARDNIIKAMGEEPLLAEFEKSVNALSAHLSRYNALTEEQLLAIVLEGKSFAGNGDAIVYTTAGRPVTARSDNQRLLVRAYEENDLVFAIGPAGTGKTYTSIALAVRALKNKETKKIILSRPAVEAGEKLGFLPGDMKEKIDPYLQPLYDALEEMIPPARLAEMMAQHIIQIAPLAFMRGRTLSDAVIILDEAQNTTTAQIKMFLTRLGHGAKMIVTGDRTQVDLPRAVRSGLTEAEHVLRGIKGIAFVELDRGDIVRHPLVTRIVNAWEQREKEENIQLKHNDNESIDKN